MASQGSERARGRPSLGTVAGIMALFVALGGTAWALSANSIKSIHIAPGEVKSSDVKKAGIKGSDIAKDTISAKHIEAALPKDWRKVGEGDVPYGADASCKWVHGPLKINVGGGDTYFRKPAFYKDPTGFVHLRGTIGAVGFAPDGCDESGQDPDDHIMFVLPQGFRPNATVDLAASTAHPEDRPGPSDFLGVRVDPDGAVMIHPEDFGAVTAFFLSLEGLSFSTK